jgi:hypothetical protein
MFDSLEDLDPPDRLSLYDYASVEQFMPETDFVARAEANQRKKQLREVITYFHLIVSGQKTPSDFDLAHWCPQKLDNLVFLINKKPVPTTHQLNLMLNKLNTVII